MGETEKWALDGAMEHGGGGLWWHNRQIRDPSNGENGASWWPDGDIAGPQILIKKF